MSKILQDAFYDFLKGKLADYLKEFELTQVLHFLLRLSQINLGVHNHLTMSGLKLKEELLLMMDFPLIISEGKIGKFRIDVR